MALPFLAAIPVIGKLFGKALDVVDNFVEDKDLANKIKAELNNQFLNVDMQKFTEQIRAQSGIIMAEANSESFLARNWRPIIMLLFGIIIFNNYILNPWLGMLFSVSVMLPIPAEMWSLLKLGLSGYVVGRSVEKGVKIWKGKDKE